MTAAPDFTRIKDGFYLVNSPEIRENPWYLTRKPGQGTYAEIANDIETGIFIAPWPYNKRIVVEEHDDPENRKIWDESSVAEVIQLTYAVIMKKFREEDR
jgi:hypothetical protein